MFVLGRIEMAPAQIDSPCAHSSSATVYPTGLYNDGSIGLLYPPMVDGLYACPGRTLSVSLSTAGLSSAMADLEAYVDGLSRALGLSVGDTISYVLQVQDSFGGSLDHLLSVTVLIEYGWRRDTITSPWYQVWSLSWSVDERIDGVWGNIAGADTGDVLSPPSTSGISGTYTSSTVPYGFSYNLDWSVTQPVTGTSAVIEDVIASVTVTSS